MHAPQLLVFFWCFTLGTAVYLCPSQPFVLTDTLAHPLDAVPSNFNCNFTFIFNDSRSFSQVNISAWDIGDNEFVQVIGVYDAFNNDGDRGLSFQGAFPPNQVVVNVQTGDNTKMVFSYTLKKRPVEFYYQNEEDRHLSVGTRGSSETGFLRLDFSTETTEIGTTWTISAESTVSIITSCLPSMDYFTFLNVFVYEGSNSTDLQVIGTLYSMYNSLHKSNSKTVTLYYAAYGGFNFEGVILLNDQLNLAACVTYKTQWSHETPSQMVNSTEGMVAVDVTLDASNGTACLTILNEYTSDGPNRGNWPIFEKVIQTDVNNNEHPPEAIVIAGAPMNNISGLELGSMGCPSSFDFPQFFDGFMRTIIIDRGILQLQTTTNFQKVSPIEAIFGMKGFMMTDHYPFVDDKQITSNPLVLQHMRIFTFNFQVVYTDVKNGSDEQIAIEEKYPAKYQVIYLAGTTGKTFSFNTTSVSMDIWVGTNYSANRGTYIKYWVTKPGDPILNNTTTTNPTAASSASSLSSITSTTAGTSITRILTTNSNSNGSSTTTPTTPNHKTSAFTTAAGTTSTDSSASTADFTTFNITTLAVAETTTPLARTEASTGLTIDGTSVFESSNSRSTAASTIASVFPTNQITTNKLTSTPEPESTTRAAAFLSGFIGILGAVIVYLF